MSDEVEVVEVPLETPVENTEVVQEQVEEPQAEKPVDPPIPKGVQKRIDRAVRQKYEAEARANALAEQLEELKRQPRPQQAQAQGAPKLEDFDNFDDYITAKTEYLADRKIQATLSEREQRAAAAQAQAAQAKTAEGWQKRVAIASEEIPDFYEVVANADVPMTPAMQQAIVESDVGPKLAYYLATHPDEAADLADLSPVAVIRALTRIEDKLAKPVKASSAPDPITPVGSKAKAEKDPSSMTDSEFAAWRKRQIAQRR